VCGFTDAIGVRAYHAECNEEPFRSTIRVVRGFVDLHCQWIAGIDDGVKTPADGVELLRRLRRTGFDLVVATPHMRPGMFDNDRRALERAFATMCVHLADERDLPDVHLASEHFFDDVVFSRLVKGEGLPYPDLSQTAVPASPRAGAKARSDRGVLIELNPQAFPVQLNRRLFDLRRVGLRTVLAHPERYQPVWKDDRCLDPLLDAGCSLLLDVCALVGKYGKAAQKAAEKLLDEEAYEAACSDAHRPADADEVARALEVLEKRAGIAETVRLLRDGPRRLLGL
jgi:protein-tyrosine phosphatase